MTTTTFSPARARLDANARNLALWTLQGWLAMFFIAAGYAKLTEPMTNLINLMGWPAVAPENMVRGLGVVEIVLALGVLTPLISWRAFRPVLLTSTDSEPGPCLRVDLPEERVLADELTLLEWIAELCRLLALGLVRLRMRETGEVSDDTGERCLHYPPDQCRHATPTQRRNA